MRIKMLWPVIGSVKETRTLKELAFTEGFQTNHQQQRSITLGVDASKLLSSLKGTHSTHTLQTFFSVLCQYSEASVVLFFVFNDSNRRKGLRRDAIELIRRFGYYSTEVEGEAGCYLASLSHSHVVDGVLSEDGDLLALGVDVLLQQPRGSSTDRLTYDVYSAKWIEEDTDLGREGMILVALLCENNDGVRDCDIGAVVQLARSGLGKELVEEFEHLSQEHQSLKDYKCSWRARVKDELSLNRNGYMERRHPELAAHINERFPSLQLLEYYINTPSALNPEDATYLNQTLKPTLPDIAGIVSFCRERFQWSDTRMLRRFKDNLFKGAINRMLYSPLIAFDAREQTFRERSWQIQVLRESSQQRFDDGIEQVKVTFSLAGLMRVATLAVQQSMRQTVWVPLPVFLVTKLPRGLSQVQYDQAASGQEPDADSEERRDHWTL
ncbi:hypothetical protein PQX77_014533 [Marasmius sp. AFHP31]|nr:hypothetical protein PQX77_014533 [Marasmius sp. AFHP31]